MVADATTGPEMGITLREARVEDARMLSELAHRAKASWGYSSEFMIACRDELEIAPSRLTRAACRCVVAESDCGVLGYYLIERSSAGDHELEAMFVEPAHMGRGVGGTLLAHALRVVAREAGRRLVIQSDPNAAGFYLAAGAIRIGERKSSSIPGRLLPLLAIDCT